ncbi:hypothetical protein EVB55_087 [Rhizobium phage RHph_Y68]|uniref:Uncharacterized protein n=1 Tax=Rhizobium phage RHph_Y68 TaxID=2509787 RepID=A0A7S5QXZ0_9CAUD|nr:hypothetical protein PP934_gp087 [Rhizobium phage RHph_Y68]QIG68022.1 hypothetical protein EVB55_087 [Rhizobium phage RHph_Y68]
MKTLKELGIRCEPAECYDGCNDEFCPYTHITTWRVKGVDQPFESEKAARDYVETDENEFLQTLNSL